MDDTTPGSPQQRHLGLRIAVGLVGLLLSALLILLGQVATKQSATTQALENYESLQETATPSPVRE